MSNTVDTSLRTNLSLVASSRPKATPETNAVPAAPTDKVDLKSLPSADFDTHHKKLLGKRGMSDHAQQTPPETVVETLSNKDFDQTGYEQKLVSDLGSHVRIQNQEDISNLNGKIPTESQLQTEFNKLAADPEIPFGYILDGCYARAHLMADTMHKDDINVSKMFVMVGDPNDNTDRLTAHNKYMDASWWYHVADVTVAENDKTHEKEAFIMDPSMFDHPIPAQQWIHQMWDGKHDIKVDITRDPQYGPIESDGVTKTFDESLQPSHEILAQYSAELAKIKDQYNHDHPNGIVANAA
jgi:hypothetical protein